VVDKDNHICLLSEGRYHFELDQGELLANSKLIAAAPDLLEALKMAHSEIHGECDFTKEQLLKIEAAIKKAQP
jgi:hypothetical protein